MWQKLRDVSPFRWATISMMVLSACFMSAAIYMTYSIDVITDWTVTVPDRPIHVGDEITITSKYRKLVNVDGDASRTLNCKNKDGVIIGYPLSKALANRAVSDKRKTGTGIQAVMPKIPDLPAKCTVAISVDYPVLPWRTVTEKNETNEFTLYPAKPEQGETSASIQTTQTQVVTSTLSGQSGSSTQSTPITQKSDVTISTKPEQQTGTTTEQTEEPEPTFFERLTAIIRSIGN